MSEKKETEVIKEVKEEVRQLTEEELENVNGGGTPLPQGIEPGGCQHFTIKELKGDPN